MSTAFPIPRSDRRVDLTATASQTVFTFPYPVLENQDVGLFVKPPAGTQFSALAYGVGYTVSGAPSSSGVTVTLVTPAVAGATYRLTGARVPSRTSSLAPYGASYRSALETELDNLTLVLQELRRDFALLESFANTATAAVPLNSPTFTGVPLAPTAAQDTNTTQLATTGFVVAQAGSATPLVDGTAAVGTSLRYARQDHVHPSDTSRAPTANPTFTGVPAAPTAVPDTNTTQLATTGFVVAQAGSATPNAPGTAAAGSSLRYARQDHTHPNEVASALWAGAISRTVPDKLRDLPHLWDAIAPANRVTAFDAASALNYCLASGEIVTLPNTEVRFGSTIYASANNGGFRGTSKGSRLVCTNTAITALFCGNGSTEFSGLMFRDFTIGFTAAQAPGVWGIWASRVSDSVFENVRIGCVDDTTANGGTSRISNGIVFDRFSQNVWYGGEINVTSTGLATVGNADQSFGAELTIDGGLRIIATGNAGVQIAGASGGVYLNRVDISNSRYGVITNTLFQPGVANRELFLGPSCTIDNCLGWGVNIDTASLAYLETTGLWVSGCGSAGTGEGGIRIAPSAGVQAKWGNLRVQSCYYDGIQLNDGAHSFDGGFLKSNGTGGPGGHGLLITGAGVSNCSVDGMIIHNNGNVTRGDGVSIGAGADNYTITNNRLFSNGANPIKDVNAPSTTRIIRDNSGWVTENSGYATLLSGNTTVVVNHGLSDTPTYVELTPASALDASAYAYAAPADFTSTTFTIRYSTSAGANRAFAWRATRGAA